MKIVAKPELSKEIFSVSPVPQLIAQSVRIYLANQRQGTQSALTRAEISRTRKKYQKQKGSGNARHGDRKAPIFVGGGVSFAPKPRDHSLSLSDKMKKQSVFGALSLKNSSNELMVVADMENLTGKTSEVSDFLMENSVSGDKVLIILDKFRDNIYKAARNISGVTVLPFNQINAYEILKASKVLIMEEAVKNKPESKKVTENNEIKKEILEKPIIKKTVIKKSVTKKTK